jgi:hypothetical protein
MAIAIDQTRRDFPHIAVADFFAAQGAMRIAARPTAIDKDEADARALLGNLFRVAGVVGFDVWLVGLGKHCISPSVLSLDRRLRFALLEAAAKAV